MDALLQRVCCCVFLRLPGIARAHVSLLPLADEENKPERQFWGKMWVWSHAPSLLCSALEVHWGLDSATSS